MTAPRIRSGGLLREVLGRPALAAESRALEEALRKVGTASAATARTRAMVLAALGLPAGPGVTNRP